MSHGVLVFLSRRGLDVEDVMVDATADWKPVEKPPNIKDEEGIFCIHVRSYSVYS